MPTTAPILITGATGSIGAVLVLLGAHPAALGETFNVTDGAPIRTLDLFARFLQMAGKRALPMPVALLKAAAWPVMRLDQLRGRDPSVSPSVVNYLMRRGKIYPEKMRQRLGWTPPPWARPRRSGGRRTGCARRATWHGRSRRADCGGRPGGCAACRRRAAR